MILGGKFGGFSEKHILVQNVCRKCIMYICMQKELSTKYDFSYIGKKSECFYRISFILNYKLLQFKI